MDIDHACVRSFMTADAFGEWLMARHADEQQLWMKIHKLSSGVASITWAEAVVEALAWGWVDGIKKANDETSWFQRFTPRTPRSRWSQINRGHAERLMAEGRMQAPGLTAVLAAKADGRWDAAYAGSAEMTFPPALLHEIAQNPVAQTAFDRLSRARLYTVYHRLQTAKQEKPGKPL